MPKKQLTENYKFWGREGSLWYFFTYFEVSVTKNDLRNAFFSEFWVYDNESSTVLTFMFESSRSPFPRYRNEHRSRDFCKNSSKWTFKWSRFTYGSNCTASSRPNVLRRKQTPWVEFSTFSKVKQLSRNGRTPMWTGNPITMWEIVQSRNTVVVPNIYYQSSVFVPLVLDRTERLFQKIQLTNKTNVLES